MREFLQLSIKLLIFTLAAGLLLALTNAVTSGPIAEQQAQQENASRYAVMPDADEFEPITDTIDISSTPALSAVYRASKGGKDIGYTMNLAPSGYKDVIGMTVGVSSEGAITGVTIDSQNETQGVGSKITEADFLGQFKGKAASQSGITSEIDTITGATVSSSTVINAVGQAAQVSEQVLGITPNAAMPMDAADEYRVNTLPGAKGFESIDLLSFLGDYGDIRGIKAAYDGSELIGYSFDLSAKGFGGPINMTLGISTVDGCVTGLEIAPTNESPEYGRRAELPEYYGQYAGISVDKPVSEQVDSLTGATGTSDTIEASVAQAVSFYNQYLKNMGQDEQTGESQAEQTQPEAQSAIDTAEELIDITDRMQGREADFAAIVSVKEAHAGGYAVGYRFTTSSTDGYNKDVPLELEIDVIEGKIARIAAKSSGETQGIGSLALEDDYLSSFVGAAISDVSSVDTLSGATMTSSAVKLSVDTCAAFYEAYISGEEAAA